MNIQFSNQFFKDLEKAKSTTLVPRIQLLLEIVKTNPFADYPPFKKLKCDENSYSRRINKQHRLVYIVEKDRIIFDRCWGHYDD